MTNAAPVQDDYITSDHIQSIPFDFNDLSAEEGLALAKMMQQQSTASFSERATYAGYNDVDVHYIRCEKDMCLPQEAQERILGIIEQSSGKAPTVHRIASGHFPTHSRPEELAEMIKDIVDHN